MIKKERSEEEFQKSKGGARTEGRSLNTGNDHLVTHAPLRPAMLGSDVH